MAMQLVEEIRDLNTLRDPDLGEEIEGVVQEVDPAEVGVTDRGCQVLERIVKWLTRTRAGAEMGACPVPTPSISVSGRCVP